MTNFKMPSQHALRTQLLTNGYVPIPVRGKQTRLPGWPSVTVDADAITAWDDLEYMPGTGLRCDNLVVFDIDTDDAGVSLALLRSLLNPLGLGLEHVLMRMRSNNDSRCAVVFRRTLIKNVNPVGVRKLSPRYVDDEGGRHGFDLLMGSTSQLAAYGRREDMSKYVWSGRGPREVALEDVACLDFPLAQDAFKRLTHILHREATSVRRGWAAASYERCGTAQPIPCLTGASVFEVINPYLGRATLDELEQMLKDEPEGTRWQCHLTAVRPDSDSGAGRVFIGRDGGAVVADHTRGILYVRGVAPGQPLDRRVLRHDPRAALKQDLVAREVRNGSKGAVDAARAAVDAVLAGGSDEE